jgi:CRISPR/Cas system CSM-associated protein Csm2 small subunit
MSDDCKYTTSDIDKILSYTSWSDKKKIDTLLHIDCTQYEKKNVRTQSRNIYRAIKSIDESKGKLLLDYMDK